MVTKMDHQNCVEITMCAHNKCTILAQGYILVIAPLA